jgi:cation diffusion facilitator family transporter
LLAVGSTKSGQCDHTFGQERRRPGEARTLIVVILTAATMVLEIASGMAYGSMALLADGLHMASHAAALGISMFAYVYARRHAGDKRFSFGTGKVNSLAGFTGAILLAVFSLAMAWESTDRLISPVAIAFNQAIIVAIVGLVVNGLSVAILGHGHEDDFPEQEHDHEHGHDTPGHAQKHDHNLRAAYLHVLADALTSVLAIVALVSGKYFGLFWLDPVMGIVGAAMVARWSVGLVVATSRVLLDHQGPADLQDFIRSRIGREEGDDCRRPPRLADRPGNLQRGDHGCGGRAAAGRRVSRPTVGQPRTGAFDRGSGCYCVLPTAEPPFLESLLARRVAVRSDLPDEDGCTALSGLSVRDG